MSLPFCFFFFRFFLVTALTRVLIAYIHIIIQEFILVRSNKLLNYQKEPFYPLVVDCFASMHKELVKLLDLIDEEAELAAFAPCLVA